MKTQLFAGKFEIQKEIAKGKTGTIFYGYDNELRQEVAIKTYHSHINGRVIRAKPFIEKAKPLLLLEHPNLINLFKVEADEDTPVVFMEFFDAPSLEQIIRQKGPLSVPEMLDIARVITEVLVHTHLQGIIHGTLHPGHVLVGPHREIKVMDLGLSWILMDILSDCDVDLLRPLHYLPPELAKGELLSVSSDLYCLGFMMYHMLTQTVPYEGLPKTSILGKLTFDKSDPEFVFPEEVPPIVCQLIQDLTRHNMQDRVQEATHVLTIIDQQLSKIAPAQRTSPKTSSGTQAATARAQSEPSQPTDSFPQKRQESTLRRTPPVQRPKHHTKYDHVRRNKILQKLGFVLGLALLICGAIAGYWYRDVMDALPTYLNQQTPTRQTSEPSPAPPTINPESQIPTDMMEEGNSHLSDQVPDMTEPSEQPTSAFTPKGSETSEGIPPLPVPPGEVNVPSVEPQTKDLAGSKPVAEIPISGSPITTSPVSGREASSIDPSERTTSPGPGTKPQPKASDPVPARSGTGAKNQKPIPELQEKTELHAPSLEEESLLLDPTQSKEETAPATKINTSQLDTKKEKGPENTSSQTETAISHE